MNAPKRDVNVKHGVWLTFITESVILHRKLQIQIRLELDFPFLNIDCLKFWLDVVLFISMPMQLHTILIASLTTSTLLLRAECLYVITLKSQRHSNRWVGQKRFTIKYFFYSKDKRLCKKYDIFYTLLLWCY